MIELRTFRNTDRAAPPTQKFLTLAIAPGGFAIQFYGPTEARSRTEAEAWMAAERVKANAAGLRVRTPAKPTKPATETVP